MQKPVHTVAEKCDNLSQKSDCCRKVRQSLNYAVVSPFRRQSHFSVTVWTGLKKVDICELNTSLCKFLIGLEFADERLSFSDVTVRVKYFIQAWITLFLVEKTHELFCCHVVAVATAHDTSQTLNHT